MESQNHAIKFFPPRFDSFFVRSLEFSASLSSSLYSFSIVCLFPFKQLDHAGLMDLNLEQAL